MIREIQGKIRKIRARFEDSKEIPGAVDVIPNRVEPLVYKKPGAASRARMARVWFRKRSGHARIACMYMLLAIWLHACIVRQ